MSQSELQLVKNVAYTLNTISVCGSDNLDKLLGCIQVLNNLITESDNVKYYPEQPSEDQPVETRSL